MKTKLSTFSSVESHFIRQNVMQMLFRCVRDEKMATRPGLEPEMRVPKTLVLPITLPGSMILRVYQQTPVCQAHLPDSVAFLSVILNERSEVKNPG